MHRDAPILHILGLRVLNDLGEAQPAETATDLAALDQLEPRRLISEAEAIKRLAALETEAQRLAEERVQLMAEGEALVAAALKEFTALDKELEIQPTDTWDVVVGKAISLRELGRTADAVAAFSKYHDMFADTDPTAAQFARTSQAFTLQYSRLEMPDGVYIYALGAESAAEQAGLQVGDIVITFAGQPVTNTSTFAEMLAATSPDTPVEITYLRLGEDGRFSREITTAPWVPLGANFMPI